METPTMRQDGPPKGGYQPFRIIRNIPKKGLGNAALIGGAVLVMGYGFYRVGQGNLRERELTKEKRMARLSILPMLQAEEDARFAAQQKDYQNFEDNVMKDVPGWQAEDSVYKTRWMSPTPRTQL